MINVLCLDPGVTTGYAFGQIDDDGLMHVTTGQKAFSPLELYTLLTEMEPDIVIYEDFNYRNNARKGLELFSVQLIGVINMYEEAVKPLKPVVLKKQNPGSVIGQYFTNKRLRTDNLYKTTTGGHANDACRHLLHWFTFWEGYKYNKKGYEPA